MKITNKDLATIRKTANSLPYIESTIQQYQKVMVGDYKKANPDWEAVLEKETDHFLYMAMKELLNKPDYKFILIRDNKNKPVNHFRQMKKLYAKEDNRRDGSKALAKYVNAMLLIQKQRNGDVK